MTLCHKSKTLKLIIVYRPPPTTVNGLRNVDFHTEFSDLLSKQVDTSASLLILGDFNIHWDNPDQRDTRLLKDTLESQGFRQHVSSPTHQEGHTIDLVITRTSDTVLGGVQVTSLISDHHIVRCYLRIEKPPKVRKVFTSRSFKAFDHEAFAQDLSTSDLICSSPSSLMDGVASYNTELETLVDRYAPEMTRLIIVRPNTAWMNEDIQTEKRKRRYERLWMKSRLVVHHQMYCEQRNKVNAMMKHAKVTFNESRVVECGTDQRALFRVVDSLLQRKKEEPPPLSADDLSVYFESKITKIRQGFPQSALPEEHTTNAHLTDFAAMSAHDVRKVVMRSPTKTCRLDPCPTWLIKQHLEHLLPAITCIINTSLATAEFPSSWKQAIVTPLLKKASLDPALPSSYRPVSNLAFLSKVLERVVAHQLSVHLDQHSLHHPFQSAYRRHHSVETALVKVQSDIMMAFDQKECVLMVLLDLSAAFDTVDHTILLSRLKHRFGISGSVLSWINSYLSGRQQTVVVGDTASQPKSLSYGVPQGSVLGPVLFSTYISRMSDIAAGSDLATHQYADDGKLYVGMEPRDMTSVSEKVANMEECLCNIKQWMVQNKLKLNDDKTEVIMLTPPRIQFSIPSITVGDASVVPSHTVRDLGCTWDEHMDMEAHVNNICRACYYHLRNISSIRDSLTREAAEKLVHALISSRLDNCNSLLYHLPDKLIFKLQKVQNTAARIVTKTPKYSSITSVLKDLHWLPVRARISFKILTLVWKGLNGCAPTYIQELLSPYTPRRTLRSADQALLQVPKCRMKHGERAFRVSGPKLWNELPLPLRQLESYSVFKSKLKTELFRQSYN